MCTALRLNALDRAAELCGAVPNETCFVKLGHIFSGNASGKSVGKQQGEKKKNENDYSLSESSQPPAG
jgi:hypothetical protein